MKAMHVLQCKVYAQNSTEKLSSEVGKVTVQSS